MTTLKTLTDKLDIIIEQLNGLNIILPAVIAETHKSVDQKYGLNIKVETKKLDVLTEVLEGFKIKKD